MFFPQPFNVSTAYRALTSRVATEKDFNGTVDTPARRLRFPRWMRRLKWLAPVAIMAAAAGYELHTSALQARLFSLYASMITYDVRSGQSDAIAFPQSGPFDATRGYTQIPQFVDRLERAGYRVTEQARVSPEFLRLMQWGIHPPYDEPATAGLRIRAYNGALLYGARVGRRLFHTFDDIPAAVLKSVLFIENRELESMPNPTANPAIEWDRLGLAGLLYAGRKVGMPVPAAGGSTLAVQLEKYRHFPNGRTTSAADKLRQIFGASLRVYKSGLDTSDERRRIVVEYLNTIPLAAQVGYGEVHGFGDGLYAWFGMDLEETIKTLGSETAAEQAVAYKHMLALLCSVRAPSYYLNSHRDALEKRIRHYTHLMQQNGMLDPTLAELIRHVRLAFLSRAPVMPRVPYSERKHIDSTRTHVRQLLAVQGFYELDRLHLDVDTTIDAPLQDSVRDLLKKLHDPRFVDEHALHADRLIGNADPQDVVYSVTLLESTPQGNLLRAQADTLNAPFDLNERMKMELGSTAKLRTVAHYLELVAGLFHELSVLDNEQLHGRRLQARDPITEWAAETLMLSRELTPDAFLELAMERKYSASTSEVFFTGGGAHTFSNFDSKDNGRILRLRDAFGRSTNLVFIRLMRDLVRFHQARLPYDAGAVLKQLDHPLRQQLLEEAADTESQQILAQALRKLRGLSEDELVTHILGSHRSVRRLSTLFLAWKSDVNAEELRRWLEPRAGEVSIRDAERMLKSYDPSRLNLLDYGYLLRRHPLEIWCAGKLRNDPAVAWEELLAASGDARRDVSTWLFKTKNRKAQDLRLRVRIEQDAFARMTPAWQKLGFPFEKLVPSLATAIGSSSDRPAALAELAGIILNDGIRRPAQRVAAIRMAAGTPYETALEPVSNEGEPVMAPAVAAMLRRLLAEVVEDGTAQRVKGAFVLPDGTQTVAGGKTGSGDNRYDTFDRNGHVTSSRPVNRTATFVFYIGDRYFGVITAHVQGSSAKEFRFTSALPVTVLKLLAPSINARLG